MNSTGDESRYTSTDLTTGYIDKRRSTDRKMNATRRHFSEFMRGALRMTENSSHAYAATEEEIESMISGIRRAADELEMVFNRRNRSGRRDYW